MPNQSLAQSIALLEKRSQGLNNKLRQNPTAKKFFQKTQLLAGDLRQKSSRLLAGAGLVGTLLTVPIQSASSFATPSAVVKSQYTEKQKTVTKLQDLLPHQAAKLSEEGAPTIENIITESTNIPVKAYYQGQSLNHHLGFVGFEQHLKRFPGDTLSQHDELQEAGIAPGLGAFGYFVNDSSQFTTKDYMREKYYCVVQTLYLENWNRDFKTLRDFYQYRKMLVFNPVNGNAVVCDIADAGPAEWTGKQFGASPEAMKALDLHQGPRKGLILMLFVDDPENKIPLGPVNY